MDNQDLIDLWDTVFPDEEDEITPVITKTRYYEIDDLVEIMNTINENTHLSILNVNARSLIKHFNEFCSILSAFPYLFDVITVEESWINDILQPLVQLENYALITKHKKKCKEGGGICVYIKAGLKYKERLDLKCPDKFNDLFDYVFIEILTEKTLNNYIIGTLYRSPGGNTVQDFNDHMSKKILPKIMKEKKNVILTGDTNINLLKCSEHSATADYLDMLLTQGLIPKITVPTRVTHSSATLIDHIFFNEGFNNNSTLAGTLQTHMSDHYMNFLFVNNKVTSETPKTVTYRPLTKKNMTLLGNALSEQNFEDLYLCNDPDTAYNLLVDRYSKVCDEVIPLKTVRFNKYKHKKKPWITNEILSLIKRRDKLHRKIRNSKSSSERARYQTQYSECTSELNKSIKVAKRNHEREKFENCKNNSKMIWQNINSIIGKQNNKQDSVNIINEDGVTIKDLRHIADAFNSYYVNVGPNLANSMSNSLSSKFKLPTVKSHKSFFLFPTDAEEVTKIINLLKPKTSHGHDNITPKLLKQVSSGLINPLVHIINLSIQCGVVPKDMKKARVIPIFKNNGSKLVMKNYRPVSLLPAFSKILERIVYNRLFHYLVKNSILHPSQYGFQKGLSCEQAILELQDRIVDMMKNKNCCVGVFMDLSKAFDTLDHQILLSKLYHYGVRGVSLDWFRNYLSDRSQYVHVNNTNSELLPITCGVPQGSILGPLLFLIYINDLPSTSKHAITVLFADDTNALYTGNTYDELRTIVGRDLTILSDWFRSNKLALNEIKTKYIIFHNIYNRPPEDFVITINGVTLERVQITQFLGVHIQENLNWKAHIEQVCNKISRSTAILAKLKHYIPRYALRIIYNSLCVSHASYALPVWGGSPPGYLKRLITLLKKGIRHVCNAKHNSHTAKLFKQCNILKLEDMFRLQCVKIMYKKANGKIHSYHASKLPVKQDVSNTLTRQSHDVIIHKIKTQMQVNSLNYKVGTCWNSLPLHLKVNSYKTMNTYVKHVKSNFLSNYKTECYVRNCYSCRT